MKALCIIILLLNLIHLDPTDIWPNFHGKYRVEFFDDPRTPYSEMFGDLVHIIDKKTNKVIEVRFYIGIKDCCRIIIEPPGYPGMPRAQNMLL